MVTAGVALRTAWRLTPRSRRKWQVSRGGAQVGLAEPADSRPGRPQSATPRPGHPAIHGPRRAFIAVPRAAGPLAGKCSRSADTPPPASSRTVETGELPINPPDAPEQVLSLSEREITMNIA